MIFKGLSLGKQITLKYILHAPHQIKNTKWKNKTKKNCRHPPLTTVLNVGKFTSVWDCGVHTQAGKHQSENTMCWAVIKAVMTRVADLQLKGVWLSRLFSCHSSGRNPKANHIWQSVSWCIVNTVLLQKCSPRPTEAGYSVTARQQRRMAQSSICTTSAHEN